MNYSEFSREQLTERITELEMFNNELLSEKAQETSLDFAWSGNLGHWYWNIKTDTVVFNELKVTTLGYTMEELPKSVGRHFFTDKIHPDDFEKTMDAMTLHMQGKVSVWEAEYRIQAKDKSWRWYYDRGKITQKDANGKPAFASGIVFDITKRKKQELRLKKENQNIHIDKLTNISNVDTFKIKAKKIIKDNLNQYAFILIDVDKFRIVNELFGHIQGDFLLKHIAKVLTLHTYEDEICARITGDKFHMLLKYQSIEEFTKKMEKIIADILNFNFGDGSNFNLVVCIGVFVIEDDISIAVMADRASLAANMIKGKHISSYFFYKDEMRNLIIKEGEIENEMHEALKNNEFKIFLQPKFDFMTGKISGAEALIRWEHPIKGMIPPNEFISIFEKNGFVTKIDMYVFEEMCKKQEKWTKEGRLPMVISINQSRLHLLNPGYVDMLLSIVKKYDIKPAVLELELTESAFSLNMNIILDITRRLHNAGFRISIDDFGSGYSSLNMLKDVSIDVVKIDREFFNESSSTARGKMVIKSIVTMAKDLGMQTVAEGVETNEQVKFLREIGCDLAQGNFYAKPMSIPDFNALFKAQLE
ncbi:putative bifunctional diguanylate cyclase/phosphodiesterase [Acetobacterium bakii]|uniref:putative bifunctional diguanylate cyclase/phosphodiesterase n=1 Tax=Acetobacterium bakii TaxID=52689 RepID=UPI000683540A|nr:GGDEF and EAL domain-containing protein [Acetobacterium bakii]